MSLIEKINSDSLVVTRRVLLIIAATTLCFLVISNFILKPKPPKLDGFAQSKKVEDLRKALDWHILYNPEVFLTDDMTCSANVTSVKDRNKIIIRCPGFSLQEEISLTAKQLSEVTNLIKQSSGFWNVLNSDENTLFNFSFPAFNFELKEITSTTTTQGLLGEEIIAKVQLSVMAPSTYLTSLLDKSYSEKLASKTKDNLTMPENSQIETAITFRKNRYGYFLPINPVIE